MNIMSEDKTELKRPIQSMPDFVEQALEERNLMDDYHQRPTYQQNDYLLWIKAKRESTKLKRLNQMLNELEQGGVYMNMDHPPSSKTGND